MSFFAIEEEETFFEDEELEKELQSRLSAVVISDLEDSDYSEEETSFHAADEVDDGEKPFNLAENLRMLQSYSNVAFNFEELEEGGVPVSNPEAPESPAKITSQSPEVIETRQLDEPLINTFLSNETSSEAEKIQAEINKEKTKNDQLKLDREQNAALKIQKLYRGFKTRTSKTGRMVRGHLESKKRIKFVEKAQQFEFEERRRVAEEIKKENELILAERIKKDEELKRLDSRLYFASGKLATLGKESKRKRIELHLNAQKKQKKFGTSGFFSLQKKCAGVGISEQQLLSRKGAKKTKDYV